MGAKQSTGNTPRVRTYSGSGPGSSSGAGPHVALGNSHGNSGGRLRTRSLVTYPSTPSGGLHIPVNGGAVGGNTGSDSSSPDENSPVGHMPMGLRTLTHSLPLHLFAALHGKLNMQMKIVASGSAFIASKVTLFLDNNMNG